MIFEHLANNKIIQSLKKKFPQIAEKIGFISKSRLGQGFSWNLLSLGVLALGGVIVNVLIVAARGEEALGVFNQVYAIYLICSQIVVFGLHHSVLRLVSYHNNDHDYCSEITISALIMIILISIPTTLLSLLLVKPIGHWLQSSEVAIGLMLTIPSLVFFSINKVLINLLNGLDEMKAFSFFRSVRFVIIPLLIILIIASGLESKYIAISLSICELILFIWLMAYIFTRILRFSWPKRFSNLVREHLSFGSRGFLSGLLIGINTKVDVLMIGYFLTDLDVGIYSFAAMLAEGLYEITIVAQLSLNPLIGKAFSKNSSSELEKLSGDFRKIFYPFMIVVGAASMLIYPLINKLFGDPAYLMQSWIVFSVIVIGIMIDSGYGAMRGVIMQGNRPGIYTLYILALVIGDTLLNLLAIPAMGIIGAGLVTMSTYILGLVYLLVISRKVFGIRL